MTAYRLASEANRAANHYRDVVDCGDVLAATVQAANALVAVVDELVAAVADESV